MPERLLTGATDGIGLALARRWTERGEPPLLHGRRSIERLEPGLFDPARYVQADLAREDGPERVAAFLDQRGIDALDALVLNAAAGWYGRIERQAPEEIRELVEVDLLATLRLCHLLIPRLRRRRGRIAFVSSVVSGLPTPRFAVYAAAKAACEGFFRSLRLELEGEIEVQVIRPGAVRTAIHRKSGADPVAIGWERFPTPTDVAARIDRLLAGPPRWRTIGARNRLLRTAGRHVPRLVDRLQERSLR